MSKVPKRINCPLCGMELVNLIVPEADGCSEFYCTDCGLTIQYALDEEDCDDNQDL